jgi:hypothetical protein
MALAVRLPTSTFERVVSRLSACVRQRNLWVGRTCTAPWTYTKIVPLRELEHLHHFSDKDGNRVEPISQGLPPEMPEEGLYAQTPDIPSSGIFRVVGGGLALGLCFIEKSSEY